MTQMLLAGSGIECVLHGEHLAATHSVYGFSQGIEVRVRPEDVEAAVGLLLLNKETNSPLECPRCQSSKTEKCSGTKGKIALLLLFLASGLLPGFEARKKVRCLNCGYIWK